MVSVQSMVLGLSAATATLASASSLSSLSSYDLPTFDYPSLNSGDVPQRLLNAITTDGIVALKNVPNYANLRERYLREAAQCAAIKGDDQFVSRKLFADGTKRMTISTNAGRELRGSAQETEAACPGFRELYEEFSQTIEHAVNSFGAALDQTSFKASDGQTAISSRRLVSEAVRLDHFHAYEAADAVADASALHSQRHLEELSLPLHEDHGLFIAMSAPKYFEVESDGRRLVERKLAADASGLVIQTSSGERVRPVLNGDELVLMMGTGASRWLQTSHAVPAVLHGMKMPEPLNGRRSLRAWFGKMTLLPAYQRMLETSSPFEAHVNATTRQLLVNEESDLKSVGCASDRRLAPSDEKCTLKQCSTKAGATAPEETCAVVCNRKGHSATDATECAAKCTCTDIAGPANICWMLCVANLPSCPVDSQTCSGQSIVCPASTTPSTTAPPSSPTSAPGSENGTPAPGTPTKAPGSPTSAPGTTPAPGAAGTTPAASTPTVNGSRSGSASSGETTPADKQGEDSVTKPAATTAVPKATPKSSAAAMAISSIACAGVAFASVVLL